MNCSIDIIAVYKLFQGEEFLESSIESIYPYVKKIICVSSSLSWTGKTGNTCRVLIEEWKRRFDIEDKIIKLDCKISEQAEQYQEAFTYLKKNDINYDFIMYIDSDEVWDAVMMEKAITYLDTVPAQAFTAQMHTYIKSPFYRVKNEPLAPVVFVRSGNDYSGVRGNGVKDKFFMDGVYFHHFCSVRKNLSTVWDKHITSCSSEKVPLENKQQWINEKWNGLPYTKNLLPISGGTVTHWAEVEEITMNEFPQLLQRNKLIGAWEKFHRLSIPRNGKVYSIALTMIVGEEDPEIFDRCMKSVAELNFDEIIIGVTDNNKETISVAKKYATKVLAIRWNDDFAAARNEVLKYAKSDYWMWLDADDILPIDSIDGWKYLFSQIKSGKEPKDIFRILYNTSEGISISKNRIIKKTLKAIWVDCVHEALKFPDKFISVGNCLGIEVKHSPRSGKISTFRNMDILERKIVAGESSYRYRFHYAMEIYLYGTTAKVQSEIDRAVRLMIELVEHPSKTREDAFLVAILCIKLARFYAYDGSSRFNQTTIDIGLEYARKGISFSQQYAELYIILGDIYKAQGRSDDAMSSYETAFNCQYGTEGIQEIDYYEFIPADKLSCMHAQKGNLELALYYNQICYKMPKDNTRIKKNREILIEAFMRKEKSLVPSQEEVLA